VSYDSQIPGSLNAQGMRTTIAPVRFFALSEYIEEQSCIRHRPFLVDNGLQLRKPSEAVVSLRDE
jgi:hypothetical protein